VRVLLKATMFSLLGVVISFAALAQKTDQSSPTRSPLGAWEAPVGHRQPSLADVPPEQSASADDLVQKINKDLDKKLRSICRGC
jgi:hypothetical protein